MTPASPEENDKLTHSYDDKRELEAGMRGEAGSDWVEAGQKDGVASLAAEEKC